MQKSEQPTDELASRRILPLATDTVFIFLAAYLILGYALALLHSRSIFFTASEAFFALYLVLSLFLMLIRRKATVFSSRVTDYAYTLLGLGSPLLFQPASRGSLLIGVMLEVVGAALVLGGLLSLNKSFGLGPENRGIKTRGMYRIVRHPIYSGYVLAEAGFFLNNLSLVNLVALMISVFFLLLRMLAEERLLDSDDEYLEYARRVRWRLIPFLF